MIPGIVSSQTMMAAGSSGGPVTPSAYLWTAKRANNPYNQRVDLSTSLAESAPGTMAAVSNYDGLNIAHDRLYMHCWKDESYELRNLMDGALVWSRNQGGDVRTAASWGGNACAYIGDTSISNGLRKFNFADGTENSVSLPNCSGRGVSALAIAENAGVMSVAHIAPPYIGLFDLSDGSEISIADSGANSAMNGTGIDTNGTIAAYKREGNNSTNNIFIYDLQTRTRINPNYRGPSTSGVAGVCVWPDGSKVVVIGYNATKFGVYDVATDTITQYNHGLGDGVSAYTGIDAAVSADGRYLALSVAVTSGKVVGCYDANDGFSEVFSFDAGVLGTRLEFD